MLPSMIPTQRIEFVKEIIKKLSLIRDHPKIGREQDRLLVGLRSIVVRDYFIFYQPLEDSIEVLRVLHSSRDIENIFDRYLDSL
jgi:toxin ParE1/3/4